MNYNTTISRHSVPVNFDISESFNEIVTVSCEIPKNYTIADLKTAIQKLQSVFADDVLIGRPCSSYDCTGKSFTAGSELIYKCIGSGYVHYTYDHSIGIDI